MTNGKLECNQPKMTNFSTDLSFGPDNEFMELVWENGQLVMEGQSNRARKRPSMATFPSRAPKFQEKDSGHAIIPEMGRKNGDQESVLDDFSSLGPSGHASLEHDGNMVPWMNYHIDDSLQNDFCSEFFAELSGANLNPPLGPRKNPSLVNRSSSFGQVVRDPHELSAKGKSNLENANAPKVARGSSEPIIFRSSQRLSSLQQWPPSAGNDKSKVTELTTDGNNAASDQPHSGNWSQTAISASEMLNRKIQKKDSPSAKPRQPNNSAKLMNFSHFFRPMALVKANLQNTGAAAVGSSALDSLKGDDKAFVTAGSSPMEPSAVESTGGLKCVRGVSMVDLESSCEPLPEPVSFNQSDAICHQESLMNCKNISPNHFQCQSSNAAASVASGRQASEKGFASAIASSSVCSGNSDPKDGMKRKNWDVEDSEFQSEDVEDESVDVKKVAKAPKRSRAAEVHNLSERRRRDRINEKMRALQELIPNCNKVDKASMLDEAIEYLKTLQLQVQIMSIGSGLCMPPMMFPVGMQQMRMPHMAHFLPMGAGMGMGVGYGLGMIDMGCTSGYPLIPVPPIHGARFPCSPISGAPSLLGMPRPCVQMFGMPGQGLHLSLPRAPSIPLSGFSTAAISAPDTLMAACSMPGPESSVPPSSRDHMGDITLQRTSKVSNNCAQIQTSTQV